MQTKSKHDSKGTKFFPVLAGTGFFLLCLTVALLLTFLTYQTKDQLALRAAAPIDARLQSEGTEETSDQLAVTQEVALHREESFIEQFATEDLLEPQPDMNAELMLIAQFEQGKLYRKSDLPILVLKGTFFEMGRQYGYLVGDKIVGMLAAFDSLANQESLGLVPKASQHFIRRKVAALFVPYLSTSTSDLLNGIVTGARLRGIELNFNDLVFLNSLIDVAGIGSTNLSFSLDGWNAVSALLGAVKNEIGLGQIRQNCDTFAAFGSRTFEGKTFQSRNTDVTVGLGLEDFPLVWVMFPKHESTQSHKGELIPFVSAGFAGQVGVSTGLNAHGVGLGQVWAFSNAKRIGAPWALSMIDVMSHARTATEASDRLSQATPHTYGNNFVFADAYGDAIALELNSETFDTFRAADPRESREARSADGRGYAIPVVDAVVRADFSMSPKIRKKQTSAAGPLGWPGESRSYLLRYAGQINRLLAYEELGTKIGVRESMVISRATADRRSGNLQLAVYANTDRRLWVAYASRMSQDNGKKFKQAFENPFVYIPFDKILEEDGFY